MRPLIRKLGWFGAAALAIGLAWWRWHLPPAPVCELEGSNDCEVNGYSADGKWFAARLIVDDESKKDKCTFIWNARTGEKVQSLPSSFQIEAQEQSTNRKTWNVITQPSQPHHWRVNALEFTDRGLSLLPVTQPLNSAGLIRRGDTLLWFDRGPRKMASKNLTTGGQGHLNIAEEWNPLGLGGDGQSLMVSDPSFTRYAIWDVARARLLVEMSNVEAMSISDDGRHAVFACHSAL